MTNLLKLFLILTISSNTLTGRIIDKKTKEELVGVQIIVNQTDTIYSDFDGSFTINNFDSLSTVTLKYISYENETYHFNEYAIKE